MKGGWLRLHGMNRIKHSIKLVIIFSLAPLMASAAPYFNTTNTQPSFADCIHLAPAPSTNSTDQNWLPQITGLPNSYQVALLTQHMINVMMEETDSRCTSISMNLRMMIFQHFVIYQQMLNAQGIYLDEQIAHQWAHVLAMILKESGGDSTNITDMCGYSISTNNAKTTLQQWKQILNLSNKSHVEFNYQTNFGLAQTSADRLIDAFRLTKDQQYDTAFLEGLKGAETPGKLILNTAIAIRRLIWFYQGFAEGRVLQSEGQLNQQQIDNPQFSARYKTGLNMALLYCGTRFMFREEPLSNEDKENMELQNAMASIAYCKLGNQHAGYAENQVDQQCFAEWATLCPALNIDIATLTPLSYFATRNQKAVCEDTFKRLLIQKPVNSP